MCQLLGMNCNVPTDICFSFTGFQARGGLTDHHRDGWGIAFFEGRGVRVFLDPKPSVDSPVAELVRQYPIHSLNVIAHIRKATQGEVRLENTHPFQRELWGRYWIFAHNGNLKDFAPALSGRFRPVGCTDSELAFCHILDTLAQRFPDAPPTPAALFEVLAGLAGAIAAHGEFNFLLSNGERLFAHCATRLTYIVRQAPFADAHLNDQDVTVDFSELTTPADRVAVIATTPLTDNERWEAIPPGTLISFSQGAPEETAATGASAGAAEKVTERR
ncbi:class II glutamine amidotransferase [Pseudothauera rhizosphaerae]|uniref:Class II glutamine amidotransferase n=1 Tax=Pseudothauera rhizosphaerae TaxID=2565932 RepID=A0A4S4AL29_9RHOO|nr:class II glutamine amidotransferase [Pseudothauera rhizosphaerae]THF60158.1 class II glutamine amidotransferase [Pseudothauera rhizosphaerae]